MRSVEAGTKPNPIEMDYPIIKESGAGLAFIEAVMASSARNAAWTHLDFPPNVRAKYGDTARNSDRGNLG